MKKAIINYYVDLAIGAAFVLSAVSGLVFLIPAEWLTQGTRVLGLAYRAWDTLHVVSSLAMMAGVAAHLALHARWIATMARCARPAPRPMAMTTRISHVEGN